MKKTELQKVLELHSKWLRDEKGGRCANLVRANLGRANLECANLEGANLEGANLEGANLECANLECANLGDANLVRANLECANLEGANLVRANLVRANLVRANLGCANLVRANLGCANLGCANLEDANLVRANLVRANLGCAKNLPPGPLVHFLHQEKCTAYKLVNKKNEGIYNGGLKYKVGKVVEVKDADTDVRINCAAGINLATLEWCLRENCPDYKILECSFTPKDVAALPIGTDGKFRVFRCKVEREIKVTK